MKDEIIGMHGWREFLQNRQEILNKVDISKQKTWNRPVRAAHGNAAEAAIRSWLNNFLPKKYGVTSGYVIPSIYDDTAKVLHYDIVIYEQLEAPILWIDNNDDDSKQGRKLAIPAKYVRAVYEVKTTLNRKNAAAAFAKLSELNEIKEHLSVNFNSGALFIDLPKSGLKDKKLLPILLEGQKAFGCWGGAVLRCLDDELASGLIEFMSVGADFEKHNDNQLPLFQPIDSVDVRLTEDGNARIASAGAVRMTFSGKAWLVSKIYSVYYAKDWSMVSLSWSRSGFAELAIQILSEMDGLKFNDTKRPSFGRIFELIDREDTPVQAFTKEDNMPFLEVSVFKYEATQSYLRVEDTEEGALMYFTFEIENTGAFEVDISDDKFKNFAALPVGKIARLEVSVLATPKQKKLESGVFKNELNSYKSGVKPIAFEKRFVYRYKIENGEVKYYAIKKRFEIFYDKFTVAEIFQT